MAIDEQFEEENDEKIKVTKSTGSKTVNYYNPHHILCSEHHILCSEHHLLTPEEAEEVLKELNVEKDKLPKISESDPAVKYLESIHGTIPEGSIVKVIRKSDTAGDFVVYRLVVDN